MPRLAILFLVAIFSASSATAERLDVPGVATVEAEINPLDPCTVGLDPELCLASYDDNGTTGLGDDEVNAYRAIDRLALLVYTPGGQPTGGVSYDTRGVSIHHGALRLLNDTWMGLNGSLPPEAKTFVTLESRPTRTDPDGWALIPVIHLPVVVQYPFADWDLDYVTPFYIPMEETPISNDTHLYPFGKADEYSGPATTDEVATEVPIVLAESLRDQCPAAFYYPAACPSWGPVAAPVSNQLLAFAAIWTSLTPNVVADVELNQTEVRLEGPASAGGVVGEGAAPRDPWTFARPGEPGLVLQASPGARLAAADTRQLTAPPSATGRVPTSSPVPSPVLAPQGTTQPPHPATFLAAAFTCLLLLGFLFHRIRKERVLELENRRTIFLRIQTNPGILIGTLASELGLSYKSVAWHARILQSCGLVTITNGTQRRLFPRGDDWGVHRQRATAAADSPVAQAVVAHLKSRGSVAMHELCAELALPKSSASSAVSRLTRAGVVTKSRSGRTLLLALAALPPAPAAESGPASTEAPRAGERGGHP